MNKRILIADDERETLDRYLRLLEPRESLDAGGASSTGPGDTSYEVEVFADGHPLLACFARYLAAGQRVPLCLLAMRMLPTGTGLDVAEQLRRLDPLVNIVIVTAFAEVPTQLVRQRLRENIYFLKKPCDPEELLSLVDSLVKSWNDRQRLRESEERWQYALEGAGDGVWDWDATTDRVYFSPQWKAMLGYAEHEIGDTLAEWKQRVHPDDLAQVMAQITDHLNGNTTCYSSEHRVRCKDGKYKWVLDRGKVVGRTADGRPRRVIGTHSDISERKETERLLAAMRLAEETLAAAIQQRLLLGTPPRHLPGLRFAVRSIPSLAVDGDFFDFFVHDDWCVDVVIGDVMGKGMAAAITGAAIKSAFLRALRGDPRHAADHHRPTLRSMIESVHDEVVPHLLQVESYATLVLARFDLRNARLDLINCGHPYPVLCRESEGRCREFVLGGMPMGFLEKKNFDQRSYALAPGDTVYFYSDGLSDGLGPLTGATAGDMICARVWEHRSLDPEAQLAQVLELLYGGDRSRKFADDVTVLGVRVQFDAGHLPLAQATMRFAANYSELPAMRDFLRQFCVREVAQQYALEDVESLEVAATETLSGIIRHGGAAQSAGEVEVRIEAARDRIRLTFTSAKILPEGGSLPGYEAHDSAGIGHYLVARLVDEVHYTSDPSGRPCVVLTRLARSR